MTTTTESQITSGKAESIVNDAEFIRLMQDLGLECQKKGSTTRSIAEKAKAVYAHIEAVREKDKEEARLEGRRDMREEYVQLTNQISEMIERSTKANAKIAIQASAILSAFPIGMRIARSELPTNTAAMT